MSLCLCTVEKSIFRDEGFIALTIKCSMQMKEDLRRIQNYWYTQQEFVTGSKGGSKNWCKMQNQ